MGDRQTQAFFKRFGARLKELRKSYGYTQEDMGKWFSVRFYQRLESGKPCNMVTVLKLSKIFKISLSELLKNLD